jgi:hypothetical protein
LTLVRDLLASLQKRSQRLFDPATIEAIPGMIEPVEQRTLYGLASQLSLNPGDQMVEFGSFFGRSTACLAQGLADNPARQPSNKIHAFDSFGCAEVGGFALHVNAFANKNSVSHLLHHAAGRLDFYPVFEHYLAGHIDTDTVRPVRAELRDSLPGEIQQIALMHIDSPKFYEELRILVDRFFPLLRDGAVIVFQDFFYHWSATLIAAIEAMRQLGILEYRLSAASSLVTQLTRTFDVSMLATIDRELSDPDRVVQLIRQAISNCASITVDRPEAFIPRLWLAAYQYLWEQGRTSEATDLIGQFFAAGGKLIQPVLDDYLEMMRAGFSIRLLYELDHA